MEDKKVGRLPLKILPSYLPTLLPSKRKAAFTLAEVLITLGIIGVVAALTIPSLIQHHKKQEATTKLKKFYSILNQAVKMSEIDNGELSTWDRDRKIGSNGEYEEETRKQDGERFYNRYLKKYIKSVSESEEDIGRGLKALKVGLADGTYFYFRMGACLDVIYDYNGEKLPNEYGRDMFVLLVCPTSGRIAPNGLNIERSRDEDIAQCKNNSYICSQLIFKDNWEFKDDYPYKL